MYKGHYIYIFNLYYTKYIHFTCCLTMRVFLIQSTGKSVINFPFRTRTFGAFVHRGWNPEYHHHQFSKHGIPSGVLFGPGRLPRVVAAHWALFALG